MPKKVANSKARKLRLGFTHSSRHNRIRFSDNGGFVVLGLLRHRLSGDRTYNEAGRDGGSKKDRVARGGRNLSLIGEQSIFLSWQLTINDSENLAIGCFIPYKEAGSNFG